MTKFNEEYTHENSQKIDHNNLLIIDKFVLGLSDYYIVSRYHLYGLSYIELIYKINKHFLTR
jgi:hypothetical protein